MKKKALAFAAAACAFGMLLSGCGSSNGSDTAAEGANIITAYNSEPQHPLIPGNTNETGGGKPVDLLFSRLISFDAKGNASNEGLSPLPPTMTPPSTTSSSRMAGSSPTAPM